jgi:hypothetical protein
LLELLGSGHKTQTRCCRCAAHSSKRVAP